MLTYNSIPEEFHGHRMEPGPRYHRFAAGLQSALTKLYGESGKNAGRRLVQAAWHLRYAWVGTGIHRIAGEINEQLREDLQFVRLGGNQLAMTSAAASIHLASASLVYLTGHQQAEPDLRRIMGNNRQGSRLRTGMKPAWLNWLEETNSNPEVQRIINVRNALAHRHVPLNVTVYPSTIMLPVDAGQTAPPPREPTFSMRVAEEDGLIDVDPSPDLNVAVDRFVALGIVLYEETSNADDDGDREPGPYVE